MENRQSDLALKKAEVRKRMEEQMADKKKKGFMTPERKKKLRVLLRKHAAARLKEEQELKAKQRRQVVAERCGTPKKIEGLSHEELKSLCREYHARICKIESAKFELEKEVEFKDYQIDDLSIVVNDLRGKFIKPTLKKVSKYENKFAKLQKTAAEFNFRNQLKTVKKQEYMIKEENEGDTV